MLPPKRGKTGAGGLPLQNAINGFRLTLPRRGENDGTVGGGIAKTSPGGPSWEEETTGCEMCANRANQRIIIIIQATAVGPALAGSKRQQATTVGGSHHFGLFTAIGNPFCD